MSRPTPKKKKERQQSQQPHPSLLYPSSTKAFVETPHGMTVSLLLLLLHLPLVHTRRLPTVNELNKRLLSSSRSGDLSLVKQSLKLGANIEAIEHGIGKSSALQLAANYGHLSIVKYLVGRGANIDAQDTSGHTPLMYASFEGHVEVVQFLLSVKANVHHACMSGETALHEAAQGGKTKVVELLLKHGHRIDPADTRWSGATPLMWAARWGHTETTRVLLEAGADHTIVTKDQIGLQKWAEHEETTNNPLYNVTGDVAKKDVLRILNEL